MSMKKVITWGIIAAFIATWCVTGNPFDLIDIVIVRPIINILFVIYNLVGDFGIAIIIFTVLLKLCIWPLSRQQLKQTKKLKKLQPEIAEIKKNCNGNRQLEAMQTSELYKKYKIKPAASILTLLIQFPIFIAIFTAIRIVATPTVTDNIENRAYSFVSYEGSTINDIRLKQNTYLADLQNEDIPTDQKSTYDFHPQLFGVVNLDAKASDILTNDRSWSSVVLLVFAIAASLMQYYVAKQQMNGANNKDGKKKKSFRELLKDAEAGKEIDQNDITNMSTGSMTKMMPIMMFIIMFSLHGALAFYYLLNNIMTLIQQKVFFKKKDVDDDDKKKDTMKSVKKIQEAEIIENKKTGTKITRISAKDNKKKRRS